MSKKKAGKEEAGGRKKMAVYDTGAILLQHEEFLRERIGLLQERSRRIKELDSALLYKEVDDLVAAHSGYFDQPDDQQHLEFRAVLGVRDTQCSLLLSIALKDNGDICFFDGVPVITDDCGEEDVKLLIGLIAEGFKPQRQSGLNAHMPWIDGQGTKHESCIYDVLIKGS